MPILTNPRWEQFARLVVQEGTLHNRNGRSMSDLYLRAGFESEPTMCSARANASRLLRTVKPVIDRIRELQEDAAKLTGVTVATITGELDAIADIAMTEKQCGAAVSAITSKAKLHGLFVDRQETGKPGDFSKAETAAELAETMLRSVNPDLRTITAEQREMCLEEMDRHSRVLQTIADGRGSASRAD